ncbi:MAG: O-antigen ligase family protein [Candidatus Shapirobacteria bacterium]
MERFFTIFWLLLIPTQLGRHFWLPESSVFGARIDYLSIILYLTDIVWFLWIINKLRIKPPASGTRADTWVRPYKKIFTFQNLILLLFVAVNVVMAEAKWVAMYRWLRLFQWIITIYLVRVDKNKIKNYLMKIIPIWIIGESFLGLLQVMNGGSLNGIWWWLGERSFVYGGIGIAQMNWLGDNWIRAYGTFSHPNSLAGFLLLGWWFWRKLRITNYELRIKDKKQIFKKVFYWIVNWSAVLGILVAGSRTVWLLTAILLIIDQLRITNYELRIKNQKIRRQLIGKLLMGAGVICLFLGIISVNYRMSDFIGGWDVNSFQKREMLMGAAVKMIKSSPLFGVGAGNFVKELPKFQSGSWYWLQPVHNIFLLLWSEIGLLGIILLITNYELRITNEKKIDFMNLIWKKYWWIWVIVGVTGLVDHYWVTLPQNSWLLAVILGVI